MKVGHLNNVEVVILTMNADRWEKLRDDRCNNCVVLPLCMGSSCPAPKIIYENDHCRKEEMIRCLLDL